MREPHRVRRRDTGIDRDDGRVDALPAQGGRREIRRKIAKTVERDDGDPAAAQIVENRLEARMR
jgi:hypothetical protein